VPPTEDMEYYLYDKGNLSEARVRLPGYPSRRPRPPDPGHVLPNRDRQSGNQRSFQCQTKRMTTQPELPEPWLRGPLPDVHPLLAPALYSFQQTREDLARHTEGLTAAQLWARPHGLAPLGFHIRHITGSVDRLTTYLEGRKLDEAQMAALTAEMRPGASLAELLADLGRSVGRAEQIIRSIDPAMLAEPRAVGRKRLPTTVIGLLTHIAEHTQRHLGQAISAAKLAAAS
jgi:hypothetical protein